MSGTNDSKIPALGIEYKEVERTADANYGEIVLKLNKESADKAEATAQKAGADYMNALKNENLSEYAQGKLKLQLDALESDISKNLASDPMYYANNNNRQRLAQKAGRIVSLENLAAARQLDTDMKAHRSRHETDGSLDHAYLNEKGKTIWDMETGREITNQQAYDIANNPRHALFNQVIKDDGTERIGQFALNTRSGNINHTYDELKKRLDMISPDTFANETAGASVQVMDAYNTMLKQTASGSETTSNEKKVELLKKAIAANWQSELGAQGRNGLEQSMLEQVNRMKAVGTDGATLPGGASFQQAMADALRNQDGREYARLQSVRDAMIRTQGRAWIEGKLDLSKEKSVKNSYQESYQNLNTAPKDSAGSGSGDSGAVIEPFGELMASDELTNANDNYLFGSFWTDGNASIPMAGNSTFQPDQNEPRDVSVDGDYYYFDKSGPGVGGSGVDGKKLRATNAQFADSRKVGNRVRYVLSGKVTVRQKDGSYKEIEDKSLGNRLLTLNDNTDTGLTKNSVKVSDDTGTYFVNGNGKRYYVDERAFHEYKTASGGVLLKPMTKVDSYIYFNKDASGTTPKLKIFKEERLTATVTPTGVQQGVQRKGLTTEAISLLKWQIQDYRNQGYTAGQVKSLVEMTERLEKGGDFKEGEAESLQRNLPVLRDVRERQAILKTHPSFKNVQTMPAEEIRKREHVE